MRISTQSFYQQSLTAVTSQQSNLLKVQQQLGASTKIVTPSDDPLGATKAVAITQSLTLGALYATNRTSATQTLSLEDNVLSSVVTTMQNIKGQIVEAGNGALSDSDRASLATSLQGAYDQLVGLANSGDGNGAFMFSGFKSGSPPFVTDAGGNVQYVGDQGQRLVQVDGSTQMPVTDDGVSVFNSVSTSAGYITAASTSNTGTALVGPASIVDAGNASFGQDFTVTFDTPTSYTVTNKGTPPATVATGVYTSGSPITFGGVTMAVSGTPAAGDSLDVSTAKNAGTDMFSTLKQLITALQTPVSSGTDADKAALENVIGTANAKLNNSYNNILTVQSAVGSRLNSIDGLSTTGDAKTLADQTALSAVRDLDYTATISQFYTAQEALDATQKVFVSVQKISLLNYLTP
jgi:flagellar hook-associated protein 3 FlgL